MAQAPKGKAAAKPKAAKAKKADVAPVEDKAGEAPRFPLFYTAPRPLELAGGTVFLPHFVCCDP